MPKSFNIEPYLSFYGTKCLFKLWANESIQQELSAMGTCRKQNIWQNIATNAFKRIQAHGIVMQKQTSQKILLLPKIA